MFFFTRSKPATHSELATAQPTGLDPVLYSRSLLAISAIISPCSAKLFAGLKAHHIRSLVCTFSAHLRSRISQSSKRQNPSIPFSLSENHPFLGWLRKTVTLSSWKVDDLDSNSTENDATFVAIHTTFTILLPTIKCQNSARIDWPVSQTQFQCYHGGEWQKYAKNTTRKWCVYWNLSHSESQPEPELT